jgi:hypothetical protein
MSTSCKRRWGRRRRRRRRELQEEVGEEVGEGEGFSKPCGHGIHTTE